MLVANRIVSIVGLLVCVFSHFPISANKDGSPRKAAQLLTASMEIQIRDEARRSQEGMFYEWPGSSSPVSSSSPALKKSLDNYGKTHQTQPMPHQGGCCP